MTSCWSVQISPHTDDLINWPFVAASGVPAQRAGAGAAEGADLVQAANARPPRRVGRVRSGFSSQRCVLLLSLPGHARRIRDPFTGGQEAPEKISIRDLGPRICYETDLDFPG